MIALIVSKPVELLSKKGRLKLIRWQSKSLWRKITSALSGMQACLASDPGIADALIYAGTNRRLTDAKPAHINPGIQKNYTRFSLITLFTISTALLTPSFFMMLKRCVSMVLTLLSSASAMSLLCLPLMIMDSICFSRLVR